MPLNKNNDIMKALPGAELNRKFSMKRDAKTSIDIEKNMIYGLSISSDAPDIRYDFYDGRFERFAEVMIHEESAIDLSRFNENTNGMVDHQNSVHAVVGIITRVYIDHEEKKLRVDFKFSKREFPQSILADIDDGIIKNVSIAFMVIKAELKEKNEDKPDVIHFTEWQPFEFSFVGIPADNTVGIDRSKADNTIPKDTSKNIKECTKMRKDADGNPIQESVIKSAAVPASFDADAEREKMRKAELKRSSDFDTLGDTYQARSLTDELKKQDITIEKAMGEVLKKFKGAREVDATVEKPGIDLDNAQQKEYKITNIIRHLIAGEGSFKENCLEKEVSDELAIKFDMPAKGAFVNWSALTDTGMSQRMSSTDMAMYRAMKLQRDLSVGNAAQGGSLVADNLMPEAFIDVLTNAMKVLGLGARVLPGLVGNLTIPTKDSTGTSYWIGEGGAPTESALGTSQKSMSPKTAAAWQDYTRLFFLQSSLGAEQLVREDIALVLALAMDLGCLTGTGLNDQPLGILNTTNVGLVEGGTNGLAPTYAHMVALETEISQDNAMIGTPAHLTNSKMRGKLKTTQRFSSTDSPVWTNTSTPGQGMINGYLAEVSNQMPSDLTKGSGSALSSIIFGIWSQLVVGMWGQLDITVDRNSLSTSGGVRIVGFQSFDCLLRHPEAFAAMIDAITT